MQDRKIMNPYKLTHEFWYRQFQVELMDGNNQLAEEHFLRFRYWLRRARLWEYLGELCKQKEFGNAG